MRDRLIAPRTLGDIRRRDHCSLVAVCAWCCTACGRFSRSNAARCALVVELVLLLQIRTYTNFISVRAPCRRDGAHHERDRFQSLFACSEPKYHSVLCPALVKHLLVDAPVNFRRSQACTEPVNCSGCKLQIWNALTVWTDCGNVQRERCST